MKFGSGWVCSGSKFKIPPGGVIVGVIRIISSSRSLIQNIVCIKSATAKNEQREKSKDTETKKEEIGKTSRII